MVFYFFHLFSRVKTALTQGKPDAGLQRKRRNFFAFFVLANSILVKHRGENTMKNTAIILFTAVFCLLFFTCGRREAPKPLVVLLNVVPAQQRYLENEVLGGFERLYNVKVKLVNYETSEELKKMLLQDSIISQITLVSVPFEMAESLAAAGTIVPFSQIVAPSVLQFDADTYYEKFVKFGKIDGEYFYFPHRIEVPVLFFLKSRVAQARELLPRYRREIERVLRATNGVGLPKGYVLDDNPNDWDLFDIFVLGYIWANESIDSKKIGRIISRNNLANQNMGMIADYSSALGTSKEAVLWSNLFTNQRIFHPLSYSDSPALASYNAIRSGEVFMTYFMQNDCFNVLEGTDESKMQPYISDLSDVGIALTPLAVSLTLDKSGNPKIIGRRTSAMNGFGWGVPKNSKEKELAYLLVQYLNNRIHHTRSSVRFGSIPVREDVLLNMQNIYGEKWLGEGYAAALYQITNFFTETEEK